MGSLFDTIEVGTPYSLTSSLTYICANYSIVVLFLRGMKCKNFINLSATQIISLLLEVFGNPDTKSIEICSHFYSGFGSGCSNPPGFLWLAFTCRYVRHLPRNSATSCFMPIHQNRFFKFWYIFVLPRWMVQHDYDMPPSKFHLYSIGRLEHITCLYNTMCHQQ